MGGSREHYNAVTAGALSLAAGAAPLVERRMSADPIPLVCEPSAYLSAHQAARYVGVSERAVRKWISAGRLPATKATDGWRIRSADLAPFRRSASADCPPPSADPATDRPQTIHTAAPPSPSPSVDDHQIAGELVTLREALAHAYDEVAYLRDALRAEQERVREAHLLLAQRPALPAGMSADGPQTTNPGVTPAPPAAAPRPWWQRWWPGL